MSQRLTALRGGRAAGRRQAQETTFFFDDLIVARRPHFDVVSITSAFSWSRSLSDVGWSRKKHAKLSRRYRDEPNRRNIHPALKDRAKLTTSLRDDERRSRGEFVDAATPVSQRLTATRGGRAAGRRQAQETSFF